MNAINFAKMPLAADCHDTFERLGWGLQGFFVNRVCYESGPEVKIERNRLGAQWVSMTMYGILQGDGSIDGAQKPMSIQDLETPVAPKPGEPVPFTESPGAYGEFELTPLLDLCKILSNSDSSGEMYSDVFKFSFQECQIEAGISKDGSNLILHVRGHHGQESRELEWDENQIFSTVEEMISELQKTS